MKSTKKATCALMRVLLLILILSLALTSCGQEEIYADEYPNWYYGSIFDPQSHEAGEPLVTYRISRNKVAKEGVMPSVSLIYDDYLIDQLIQDDSAFKVTAMNYDITETILPAKNKEEILVDLELENGPRRGSLVHNFGIARFLTCESGIISLYMELTSIDVEYSAWYLNLYYVQHDDAIYLFDNFEEFYKCRIKAGYV